MNKPKEYSALIAVSGGLDSICLTYGILRAINENDSKPSQKQPSNKIDQLLRTFIQENNLKRVELAYIDHSQRDDTSKDIAVIKELCKNFAVKFHTTKLLMPPASSEHELRKARYAKLNEIMQKNNLDKLITAHHADDIIETAIINLKRGTGPRGLSSLSHHQKGIWRPFLFKFNQGVFIFKDDLKEYSKQHKLMWHEDSTNSSLNFLRNKIRKHIKRSLSLGEKNDILSTLSISLQTNSKLSTEIKKTISALKTKDSNSQNQKDFFSRASFTELDEPLQMQIVHHLLSLNGYDVNRQSVKRAVEFINRAETKKTLQLKGCDIYIPTKESFQIYPARQK